MPNVVFDWIEDSGSAWNAAHLTLLRVTGIANPRSNFLPTFVVITSKISNFCVTKAGTFYFIPFPRLNIACFEGSS